MGEKSQRLLNSPLMKLSQQVTKGSSPTFSVLFDSTLEGPKHVR
jgi:hypothetical protein